MKSLPLVIALSIFAACQTKKSNEVFPQNDPIKHAAFDERGLPRSRKLPGPYPSGPVNAPPIEVPRKESTRLPVTFSNCEMASVDLFGISPPTLRITDEEGVTSDETASLDDVKIHWTADTGRQLFLYQPNRRYTIVARTTCCPRFELQHLCDSTEFYREIYDMRSIPDGSIVRWDLSHRSSRLSYVDEHAAVKVLAPAVSAGNRSDDADGPKIRVEAERDGTFIRMTIRAYDPSGVRSITYYLQYEHSRQLYSHPVRIDPGTTRPEGDIIATDNLGNQSKYTFWISGEWGSGTIIGAVTP